MARKTTQCANCQYAGSSQSSARAAHGVVWCGMAWHGMVGYGMVRSNAVLTLRRPIATLGKKIVTWTVMQRSVMWGVPWHKGAHNGIDLALTAKVAAEKLRRTLAPRCTRPAMHAARVNAGPRTHVTKQTALYVTCKLVNIRTQCNTLRHRIGLCHFGCRCAPT